MEGWPPDMQVARENYEKSVVIGWLGSYEPLARMLRDGMCGPADEPRAIALLEKKA